MKPTHKMNVHEDNKRYLKCALGTLELITTDEIESEKRFTVEVPNSKIEGFSPIIKNLYYEKMEGTIIDAFTVHQLFERASIMYADQPFLGRRAVIGKNPSTGDIIWSYYKFLTYSEVQYRSRAFGTGLMKLLKKYSGGCEVGKENIPIMAEPCVEWIIADLGITAFSNVLCAIQTNTDLDTMIKIIKNLDSVVIITTVERAGYIINHRHMILKLKCIMLINFDPIEKLSAQYVETLRYWGNEKCIDVVTFEYVEEEGKKCWVQPRPPTHNDAWCICYSSGSTGVPKGAIIKHENIMAIMYSIYSIEKSQKYPISRLFHLSIAHILEKEAVVETACTGGRIYFTRGANYIIEDLAEVAPECLITVPRILSHMVESIAQKINKMNQISSTIAKLAIKTRHKQLEPSFNVSKLIPSNILQIMFLNSLKSQIVGPNMKQLMSGAAPLRKDVADFIHAVTGIPVMQGYGLTESSGFIFMNLTKGTKDKQMGYIAPLIELRFKSVPEMKLYAENFEGEIWVRGPSIFKGYYKDEKATKEMLTDDGWCKTGDVGKYDSNTGIVHIIGRLKVAFKLSQGEFINPENVERVAGKSKFINQLLLTGRSSEDTPILLVTPNREVCIDWIKSNINDVSASVTNLPKNAVAEERDTAILHHNCNRDELKNAILKDVENLCRNAGLKGYMIPKLILIDTKERWSVSNNCLSSLSKPRRIIINQKYCEEIDNIYNAYHSKNKKMSTKL